MLKIWLGSVQRFLRGHVYSGRRVYLAKYGIRSNIIWFICLILIVIWHYPEHKSQKTHDYDVQLTISTWWDCSGSSHGLWPREIPQQFSLMWYCYMDYIIMGSCYNISVSDFGTGIPRGQTPAACHAVNKQYHPADPRSALISQLINSRCVQSQWQIINGCISKDNEKSWREEGGGVAGGGEGGYRDWDKTFSKSVSTCLGHKCHLVFLSGKQ